jgi:hypothetical protein
MTEQASPPFRKHRGTIIVDSSALFYLTQPTDKDSLTHPTDTQKDPQARYMDVLYFLGQQGYDVIIPEMCSYECAEILSTGQTADALFTHTDKYQELKTNFRTMLRAIAHHAYPNVSICPPPKDCHSESADFIRNIANIVTTSFGGGEHSQYYTRSLLKAVNAKRSSGDFGEQAAADLVQYKHQKMHEPFFFLSNDARSFAVVRNAHPDKKVAYLSVTGLLHALHDTNLLAHAGFPANISVENIRKDLISKKRPDSHDPTNALFDRIDTFRSDFYGGGYPFKASLLGLKEEIDAEKTAALSIASEKPGDASDRIAKFKARYGHKSAALPDVPSRG